MTKSSNAFKAMEVRVIVVLAIIAMACTFMTSCDNNIEFMEEHENLFTIKDSCSVTFSVKGISETTRSAVDALEFVEGCRANGWSVTLIHQYTNDTVFYSGENHFKTFSTRIPRGPWSITLTIGPTHEDEDIAFSSDKSLIIEDEIYIDHDNETFEFKPQAACAAIAWDMDDLVNVFYETRNGDLADIPYRIVGNETYGLCFIWINPEKYPNGTLVKLWGLDYRGEYRRIEIDYTKNGFFYPIETSYMMEIELLPEEWKIGGYGFYWKSGF